MRIAGTGLIAAAMLTASLGLAVAQTSESCGCTKAGSTAPRARRRVADRLICQNNYAIGLFRSSAAPMSTVDAGRCGRTRHRGDRFGAYHRRYVVVRAATKVRFPTRSPGGHREGLLRGKLGNPAAIRGSTASRR